MYRISDLQNQFPKQKLNKAKKMSVRELEETQKNHFICFVDDEQKSCDVRIVRNAKSEITGYSCDCGAEDFCLHILAMGLFISENKSGKAYSKKSVRKKASDAELAMENLNSEELKIWLLEFFKKNKEAEVEFMLSFGEKKKDFSGAEISEIIKNTTTSVAGKKKNLTAPEVKKIVDLLTKAIEPVEQYLFRNPGKKESIEKFLMLNEEISNYQLHVSFSSTRFDTFQQKLRERFVTHINTIKDVELWKEIATVNWNIFLKGKKSISFHTYYFIRDLYNLGDKDQKKYIAVLVKDEIKGWMDAGFDLRTSLKEDLLPIIAENGFFAELQNYFPVERYENFYNLKVIDEILKIDQQKAEEACRTVISYNSNDKYDVPYYHILENIYKERNSPADLAEIRRKIFWEAPTLENYIFIAENDKNPEEFRKFRNRVLSALKGSFYSYPLNALLYFAILDYEENYKKMLSVIDRETPAAVINQYAEKLFLMDKNKFLNAVKSGRGWGSDEEDEEILARFLVSKYDVEQLKEVFSKKYYGFEMDEFSKMVLSKIKS